MLCQTQQEAEKLKLEQIRIEEEVCYTTFRKYTKNLPFLFYRLKVFVYLKKRNLFKEIFLKNHLHLTKVLQKKNHLLIFPIHLMKFIK